MTKTSNAMWGGRFAAGPDAIMEAINASIGFDKRLAAQDIAGSRAHAAMLAATGIVSDSDAEAMREGLLTVLSEIEEGRFEFSTALEDIHMNVEARLKEVIGEPAGRLHTGRSRNDQVATDFKLWVRDQLDAAEAGGDRFQVVGAGPAGCRRGGACRAYSSASRPSGDRGRLGDAGLHAFADGAARDVGASHDGLCGDVRAGFEPGARCAGADE